MAERQAIKPLPPVPLERCLTLEEVAERHGLTGQRLRAIIRDHEIPVLWFGLRTIRFDRIALEALQAALRPKEAPPILEEISAPPVARGNDGWVYFIQSGNNGPIKIGTARDVRQRLKALQTAHHQRLRLVGAMLGGRDREQRLLSEYAKHRISGEWHAPTVELIQFIRVCGRV